jgi:hypothetical protein
MSTIIWSDGTKRWYKNDNNYKSYGFIPAAIVQQNHSLKDCVQHKS